jgi:DNA polymerase I
LFQHFNYEDILYDDVVYNKGAKKGTTRRSSHLSKTHCSKAKAIFKLKDQMIETLKRTRTRSFATDIEIPLSTVLAAHGI